MDMEPVVRHHRHVEDTDVRAMALAQLHVAQNLAHVMHACTFLVLRIDPTTAVATCMDVAHRPLNVIRGQVNSIGRQWVQQRTTIVRKVAARACAHVPNKSNNKNK